MCQSCQVADLGDGSSPPSGNQPAGMGYVARRNDRERHERFGRRQGKNPVISLDLSGALPAQSSNRTLAHTKLVSIRNRRTQARLRWCSPGRAGMHHSPCRMLSAVCAKLPQSLPSDVQNPLGTDLAKQLRPSQKARHSLFRQHRPMQTCVLECAFLGSSGSVGRNAHDGLRSWRRFALARRCNLAV